ncbi:MAG TPA: GAF domain-containing protein [Terriglobales bacterium]|jgi:phosphoserine phosphatase RsbU/P|nr:GAF domain-containing protein [Terriglobales bacterium]
MTTTATPAAPSQPDWLLMEVAEVVNTTLDLNTILRRVAELVRRVIDYEHFAILLLNEKTQELRIRFSIGHPPDAVERCRIKVGQGVTGLAAQRREPVRVNDVRKTPQYIETMADVRSELAVPLIIKNRVIGVIDIEAAQPGYFTEDHQRLLSLVASRIASGIENARLYTRVSRQAKTLAVLNEISRDLTSILHLDALLQRVGEAVTRLIDYQMFSVLLVNQAGTLLEHRFSLRFNETVQVKHDIPIGKGLVGYSALNKTPVLVADVHKDPRYINTNPETRSELCVPLIYKDKVIGVLDIEHTRRGYFTDDHLRTMTTLAAQVAIAIENARLYERVAKQERRLQKDLALAHELQFRLLPHCCPVMGSAELAAKFVPAREIGGDLYDFLQYERRALVGDQGDKRNPTLGIAIGDVSGKGAPAALYAALASGYLRSHAVSRPGAAEMLSLLNQSLGSRRIDGQYISVAYAVWDDQQKLLRVANSGLPRPLHCRAGHVERVDSVGLPIGLFDNVKYDEANYDAQPGDEFVFFSDGVLDAQNREGDQFGERRLERVIAANSGRSADAIVTAIFAAVAEFTAGEAPYDDQTVVVLKVLDDSGKRK